MLGDHEGAIAILDKVIAESHVDRLNHVKVDPDLDPLRPDPRFQAMVAAADARLASQREYVSRLPPIRESGVP
jgi:hypothetical protein